MKAITEQQRLEAFALYTMANQHYARCREYERAASEIIGITDGEYNEQISDGIYGYDAGRPLPFDEVLKRAGIVVTKPQKTGPKKKSPKLVV
jgi:hypothetical protein